MSAANLVGVLLAAGKGTRMGRTKQLIEIPCSDGQPKPLVAVAFDSIAWACHQMVVVVDAHKDLVVDSLGQRIFSVAEASGTRQMSESIQAGLRLASERAPCDSVLLQLGDHPHVRKETIDRLCDESKQQPERTIIPTCQGRGGHPIWIPPAVIEHLLSTPAIGALSTYWHENPNLCVRCEVGDASIVRDLDNPAQLADEVQQRSRK